MLTIIKKLVNGIFNSLGYSLIKYVHSEPIDLRGAGSNPKSLGYYTNTNRQILINADFNKGRGLGIFSLSNNSNHPFIVAIKSALISDNYKKELKNKLSKYYGAVQPQSASAWLGFDSGEVVGLDKEPPWLGLLPWEGVSINERRNDIKNCAIYDNKEHGFKVGIYEGWRDFGPVSENVLNIEVNRLHSLMISIEKNGVLRNNQKGGDICAIVLMKDDNDFCCVVLYLLFFF